MRIFCAVRHSNSPQYYFGRLWSGNFYPALRRLGHEILESQTDLLPTSRFMHIAADFTTEELQERARTTEQILDELRTAHEQEPVDLFLSYFYNAHFDPAGFDEILRLGITSVNFYCNSIYQFPFVAGIAAKVDYSWHPEKNARELYLRAGARPVWVQMGADPQVYRPLPNIPKKASACFVGQRYADRDRWMAAVIRAGIAVTIYGSGWGSEREKVNRRDLTGPYLGRPRHTPGGIRSYLESIREVISAEGIAAGLRRLARQIRYRQETAQLLPLFKAYARGPIPFEEISEVFAAHEVCLNFSNVWADGRPGSALIPHVRLRDFEGPMCRTCYLTGETDEIHEFYSVGKEIDTYSSEDELIEKTKFYLGNPEVTERLRKSAYARALRDHTWVKRFDELFGKIQIKPFRQNSR
jgi:spore maturation protein CgeB